MVLTVSTWGDYNGKREWMYQRINHIQKNVCPDIGCSIKVNVVIYYWGN